MAKPSQDIISCCGYVVAVWLAFYCILTSLQRIYNHKLEIVENICRYQRYATCSGRHAMAALGSSTYCILGTSIILGDHRALA